MKRWIAALLALLMLTVPALAEHENHVFAPDGAGISLTMDHEWFHALAENLYGNLDRASSDPCEYSDLFFIYVDEALPETAEGLLLFALSNRLTGSEHVPESGPYAPLTVSEVLIEENGRELLLWYNDAASLPAGIADKLMLPVNRILGNPGDVAISEPVPMPVAVGFDALYGINAVDQSPVTADVLTGKKLTMVNIWATYCNPCIAEMPELAKLHADYADKGFQIIGIVSDAGVSEAPDGEAVDFANAIIDQTGADYLHIIPGEGMMYGALSNITAVPTTYFIDMSGNIVGEPVVGSKNYEGWAAIIEQRLAEVE